VLPIDAALLLAVLLVLPLLSLLALLSTAAYSLARRRRWMPADRRHLADRAWVRLPAAVVLVAYVGAVAWGAGVEVDRVETTRTEIPAASPVLGEERFRIVHLSDLHLEEIGTRERRVVEQVTAAKPHLIVITGDLMNARYAGVALAEFLGALQGAGARHGIWVSGGPMDEKFPTREMVRRAGAEWIEDETRLIEVGRHRLRLAAQGAWPAKRLSELLRGLEDGAFTVYVRHSPEGVEDLETARRENLRVDLFLCGGTHGGQVSLPGWGAIVTGSALHKRYERGRYEVEGTPVYVNRGVGTTGPPIRLFARPEVAVIELVSSR
jgi:predicted MPP superfamily phosphohydrolase